MSFRRKIPSFRAVALQSLREDAAWRDETVKRFVPSSVRGAARLVAQEDGVIAGAFAAAQVFRLRDRRCRVKVSVPDGRSVRRGQAILHVRGPFGSLLSAERSALNILSHLSGVATLTRRFVRRAGPRVKVLDTRKTLPGLRAAQKWAVFCGGGTNHRTDLRSILIKENHLAAIRDERQLAALFRRIRAARRAGRTVEMECQNPKHILWGLFSGADILLLDNFSPRRLRRAVRRIDDICRRNKIRRPLLEASGGITLGNIRTVAMTGVDRISVGRLTHSAPAWNVSMDVQPVERL
jgi:nicotinate-nucleotide pyrophosphorylase (carboxylating)